MFTNVLMADELNAPRRAQSALLEAMEERQVSMDGTSHRLPDPFMVVATQNPYDAAGTSPLPHGQRDRFLVRLSLGYPDPDEEDALLARANRPPAVDVLGPAVSAVELRRLMDAVTAVYVSPLCRRYVGALAQASRRHPSVAVGASPCAALAVIRTASALAVADGRAFVTAGDVETACEPALAHRLQLSPEAEVSGVDPADIVRELLRAGPGAPGRRGTTARPGPVNRGLRPTARGAGVAAAGVVLLLLGVATRTNGPYALAALAWVPLLAAPAVASRRARACQRLSLHVRAVPALVPAGAPVSVEVVASNRGRRGTPPVGIEWRRSGRRRLLASTPASWRPFPAWLRVKAG